MDAKELLAKYIGSEAADDLFKKILQMVDEDASVKEISLKVTEAFQQNAPEKLHEEGCGTATTAGAAIGTAAGTAIGNMTK
ncbi:MAG: hypothetical protein AB7D47_09775 [Desulfovibrio sp.]